MFEGLSLEGRRAINLALIAYADALHSRLAAAGLADLAREATRRRVYDTNFGGHEECAALMERATRAIGEIERTQDDLALIKGRTDALRGTVRYRGAADTVPSPDSLQAAGQVLLDEYWDLYKVLLR